MGTAGKVAETRGPGLSRGSEGSRDPPPLPHVGDGLLLNSSCMSPFKHPLGYLGYRTKRKTSRATEACE